MALRWPNGDVTQGGKGVAPVAKQARDTQRRAAVVTRRGV
eukprot:CAMPEP_0181213304 /NCGR_PEP_ID=MMETSP1096-20121128/24828_1 /TAXON_ID=156174 ORGANISM="Chrysochromulina ericina, Strain CCMP281" /NCGR_SAMPLE_ID=MMETSP1096 /ASSEMBLY_ACC=CAM_ASM_000453 /LENGTH=39 /DNA_ID= /DNA_START= /DNA_END= /DNA_ORIENTATION=